MEEIEVPLEKSQEDIHERAKESGERWVGWVAMASALLAALAAVAALQAGHHVNEAGIAQLKASDKWNEYQAKKQKSLIVATKDELLEANGKPAPEADEKYLDRHGEDEKKLMEEAKDFENESSEHLRKHHPFSYSVTMFQVAIAVAAISVLSKRRHFFYVTLGFGAVGLYFFCRGFF